MRAYSKVSPRLWTGRVAKAMRGNPYAQALAAYLISNPHANMIGLYHLPPAYIAADLGWDLEIVAETLAGLCEEQLIAWDPDAERVWVIEHARHELGESLEPGDKRIKGIEKQLQDHASSPLAHAFVERYGSAFNLKGLRDSEEAPSKPLGSPFGGPSEPLPSPLEGPSEPGSVPDRARSACASTRKTSQVPESKRESDDRRDSEEAPSKPLRSPFGAPWKALRSQEQEQEQDQEQEQGIARPDALAPLGSLLDRARSACASTRKTGRMADSVWQGVLTKLEQYPRRAVRAGIRTYLDRGDHLDDKDERYLLGIVRRMAEERARERGRAARRAPKSLAPSPPPESRPPPRRIRQTERARELWEAALERLRDEVDPQSWNTWFQPTQGGHLDETADEQELVVIVPNEIFADWLPRKWGALVGEVVGTEVRFEPGEPVSEAKAS